MELEGISTPSRPADAYGCINWQPELPDRESDESLENKRQELITLYDAAAPVTKTNFKKIDKTMNDTYYLQRKFINTAPSIKEIKDKWPFLFRQKWLFKHFLTLTGIPVHSKIAGFILQQGQQDQSLF